MNRKTQEEIIKNLHQEDEILKIMKHQSSPDIYEIGLKKIGIGKMDQEELLQFLKKNNDDQTIKSGLRKLLIFENKSEAQHMSILKAADFDKDYCKEVAERIDIENMSEQKIINLINKTWHSTAFLGHIVGRVKSVKAITLMIYRNNKNSEFCTLASKYLGFSTESEDKVWKAVTHSNFNKEICMKAIPFLHSESKIVEIIEEGNFTQEICEIALQRLEKLNNR